MDDKMIEQAEMASDIEMAIDLVDLKCSFNQMESNLNQIKQAAIQSHGMLEKLNKTKLNKLIDQTQQQLIDMSQMQDTMIPLGMQTNAQISQAAEEIREYELKKYGYGNF